MICNCIRQEQERVVVLDRRNYVRVFLWVILGSSCEDSC